MVEAIQQFKELNEQEQAVYFHSRARSRSFRDPTKELFRTHKLGVSEASIDTDVVFPSRDRPVTFCTEIGILSETPSGVIFEFGDSTNGSQLSVSGGNLEFAAGAGGVGTDGIEASVAVPALNVAGAVHHLVIAINPGAGKARIWADGLLKGRIQQSTPESLLNGEWSNAGLGAIGAAAVGLSNDRVTVNGAPSGFVIIKPFEVYMGQLPRQFNS